MSYYYDEGRGYLGTLEYLNMAARYTEYKKKTFSLKKEAREWAEKIKKGMKGSGISIKIETNYLSRDGTWEGVVLQRVE